MKVTSHADLRPLVAVFEAWIAIDHETSDAKTLISAIDIGQEKDGAAATKDDLRNVRQEMDLWNGLVTSRFEVEGTTVVVTTACHPTFDAIAGRIEFPLVASGRLTRIIHVPLCAIRANSQYFRRLTLRQPCLQGLTALKTVPSGTGGVRTGRAFRE